TRGGVRLAKSVQLYAVGRRTLINLRECQRGTIAVDGAIPQDAILDRRSVVPGGKLPQLISQYGRCLLHCRTPNDKTGAGESASVMPGLVGIGICHQASFYSAPQHSGC